MWYILLEQWGLQTLPCLPYALSVPFSVLLTVTGVKIVWLTRKEEDITHVFHIIMFKKWNHESDKFRWNITLETGRGFFFPVKRATQLFSKVANMKLDFHLNGNGSANQGRGKTNKIGLSLTTLQKRVVQAMFQFSSFSLQVQKTKNTMRTATRPENHQHSALKQLPWKD